MIKIQAKPRETISWDIFTQTHPANSIALDGYVEGPPRDDVSSLHANFNHHEGVNRIATRCTAAQVFMSIKQGLLTDFLPDKITLCVNDCDQDVCTAVWLFLNWERLIGTKSEPLIGRLIFNVDMFDTCAGSFPVEASSRIVKDMCWIFEPYTSARVSGQTQRLSDTETLTIIEAVCQRITQYTLGMGQHREPDIRYDVIGGGSRWKLVRETGNEARTAMRRDGIQTFVSYRGRNPRGNHIYSIGNLTAFGGANLAELYQRANELDGISLISPDRWGGSDSCGGSPRTAGSGLTPEKVGQIFES